MVEASHNDVHTSFGTVRPPRSVKVSTTVMLPPPICITSATPPPSHLGHDAMDEDSTDWEDAEEVGHAVCTLPTPGALGTSFAKSHVSFRPIDSSLTLPPYDLSILTTLPPVKEGSLTACDETTSSSSRESTHSASSKCERNGTWSDAENCFQRVRARWPCSDDPTRGSSTEKWPYRCDSQHSGGASYQWPYDPNVLQVPAPNWQYGTYVERAPTHRWTYGTDSQGEVTQNRKYYPDTYYCDLPQQNIAPQHWQDMLMHGCTITQPQPTVPYWGSAEEESSESTSAEPFPDTSSSYYNSRQSRPSVLNRISEIAEKDAVSTWIPAASYPAGACGLLNQLAQRNHNLKEIMLANSNFASTLNVDEDDESSQDEEDDGLDE